MQKSGPANRTLLIRNVVKLAVATCIAQVAAASQGWADPLICDGFNIKLAASADFCLTAPPRSGAAASMRPCSGGGTPEPQFVWSARMARDGAIFLNPAVSSLGTDPEGLRLEVQGWSNDNDARVQLWGANLADWSNQQWFIFPARSGVTIRNQHSRKCLAAWPRDGFTPVQFECHDRDVTTKWTIIQVFSPALPGCS